MGGRSLPRCLPQGLDHHVTAGCILVWISEHRTSHLNRLLPPSARTDAGYRLYTDRDLFRLQQILINRELGLSLDDIRRSLDDPAFDRRTALLIQREQLQRRARETASMIAGIDAALAMMSAPSSTAEISRICEGFDPADYATEVADSWHATDAFRTAAARTAAYTPEDWLRFRSEVEAVYRDAAALMSEGAAPSDPRTIAIAQRHRQLIDKWFHPCDARTHAHLAALYETDGRCRHGMERQAKGLSSFFIAAMHAAANSDA